MKTYEMLELKVSENVTMDVEYTYYPPTESEGIYDPPTASEVTIDTVWLHDSDTQNAVDITECEGILWKMDEVLDEIYKDKR